MNREDPSFSYGARATLISPKSYERQMGRGTATSCISLPGNEAKGQSRDNQF